MKKFFKNLRTADGTYPPSIITTTPFGRTIVINGRSFWGRFWFFVISLIKEVI